MNPPRYRDITAAQIPKLHLENGVEIHIICGHIGKRKARSTTLPLILSILTSRYPAGTSYTHHHQQRTYGICLHYRRKRNFLPGYSESLSSEHKGFSSFDTRNPEFLENETLILFSDGDTITITTEEDPVRFLLISGKPLNEPVAWNGPIVMNTEAELRTAFEEYQNGTFIHHR